MPKTKSRSQGAAFLYRANRIELDVEVGHTQSVGLDKVATGLYGVPHQGGEELVGTVVSHSWSGFISPSPL